jgi:hypothetical protein
MACPHGIVYGIKFLLRGESPRPFVDLLLSLRQQPTLFVCDLPGHVAAHGNNRSADMFQPLGGRFAEPTPGNIESAKQKNLDIDIPELDVIHWALKPQSVDHTYSEKKVHPLTGSSKTYCGFDRFHENNSRVPVDRMRRLDLVVQLRGRWNTQVMEELFGEIQRSRYYLCQLEARHHIFAVKLFLHLRNQERNVSRLNKIKETALKCWGTYSLSIAEDKRVCVAGT